MDWIQTLTGIVATAMMCGATFKFMWSRIDKKFEGVMEELKSIKTSISNVENRITRLETQDEERFRNEIKLLVAERKAK